jgi:hypothetical protein
MSTKTIRDTRREEITAACNLFSRKGYLGITFPNIGRAVGISACFIYYIFPNVKPLDLFCFLMYTGNDWMRHEQTT